VSTIAAQFLFQYGRVLHFAGLHNPKDKQLQEGLSFLELYKSSLKRICQCTGNSGRSEEVFYGAGLEIQIDKAFSRGAFPF
jgi:hypothetical protein